MELNVSGPQWVRIRVEGALSATVNPAYAARQCETPYQLNCYRVPFTPFVGQPIGPYGVPDPSSDALFYPYSHAFVVEGYRGFRETSTEFNFFPAGESATEALVWVPQGGRLLNFSRSGSRHRFTPCWECGPIHAYLLSGQQEVSVRAAAPPLEVESTGPDTAGVVRFEVKPVAGFDQGYLVQAITWHYVAGDTAALPNWNSNRYLAEGWYAKSRSFADSVRGCTGKQTCEMKPPAGGGRMYARFTLLSPEEHRYITVESVVASEVVGICRAPVGGFGNDGLRASATSTGAGCGEPELVLECKGEVVQADGSVVQEENRVTRGRTLSCTVATQPSSVRPSQIRWNFADADGNAIPGPTDVLRWGGQMVVGGQIEVSARVDGRELTKTAAVQVRPRSWRSPIPPIRVQEGLCFNNSGRRICLDYPPTRTRHMGTTLPEPAFLPLPDAGAHVDSGPNRGWSFLAGSQSPVQFEYVHIYLNLILSADAPGPQPARFWAERPGCVRSEVREHVLAHEMVHATLQQETTHVFDAYLEKQVAFVPLSQWLTMLEDRGSVADAVADYSSFLAGGNHRDARFIDFLHPAPCDLKLPN